MKMAQFLKLVIKAILSVLPIICIISFAIAIAFVIISINPSVTWNTYEDTNYDGFGIDVYFSHSLWSYLDKGLIEGNQGDEDQNYEPMLNDDGDKADVFKGPVIDNLYKSIGLNGSAVLFLLVGITVHIVRKEKIVVIISKLISVATGVAGGYFLLDALNKYKHGIPDSVYVDTYDQDLPVYDPSKDKMTLGYDLALCGAIISIGASAFLFICIGFYIPYGEGKWIWEKKSHVSPEKKEWDETKETPMENVKSNDVSNENA